MSCSTGWILISFLCRLAILIFCLSSTSNLKLSSLRSTVLLVSYSITFLSVGFFFYRPSLMYMSSSLTLLFQKDCYILRESFGNLLRLLFKAASCLFLEVEFEYWESLRLTFCLGLNVPWTSLVGVRKLTTLSFSTFIIQYIDSLQLSFILKWRVESHVEQQHGDNSKLNSKSNSINTELLKERKRQLHQLNMLFQDIIHKTEQKLILNQQNQNIPAIVNNHQDKPSNINNKAIEDIKNQHLVTIHKLEEDNWLTANNAEQKEEIGNRVDTSMVHDNINDFSQDPINTSLIQNKIDHFNSLEPHEHNNKSLIYDLPNDFNINQPPAATNNQNTFSFNQYPPGAGGFGQNILDSLRQIDSPEPDFRKKVGQFGGYRNYGNRFEDRGGSGGGYRGYGRGRGRGRGGFNNYGNRREYNNFDDGGSNYSVNNYQSSNFRGNYNNNFSQVASSPQQTPLTSNPIVPTAPIVPPVTPTPSATKKQQTNSSIEQIPHARLCWPTIMMYAVGVQISCTQKPLYQCKNTDILVVPFKNLDFDLYGGNVIFSSPFDYCEQIEKKQMQNGDCYIHKAIENGNIKTFAFIKVDQTDTTKSFVDGLQCMAKLLMKQLNIARQKIVIPICIQLGDIVRPYQSMVQMSSSVKGIKKIQFNTANSNCFQSCITSWLSIYRKIKKIVSIE